MSLAWRSPRSIPTGQDGRRPLQHKLKVTYIYVLKCITHPLRTELPFSFRRLQPSRPRHPLGYTDTELHHYYLGGPVSTVTSVCVNFAKESWTYHETIHGGGEACVSWKLNDWSSIDSRFALRREIRDWIFGMWIIYSFAMREILLILVRERFIFNFVSFGWVVSFWRLKREIRDED